MPRNKLTISLSVPVREALVGRLKPATTEPAREFRDRSAGADLVEAGDPPARPRGEIEEGTSRPEISSRP